MHLNALTALYQEKNFVGPNHLINFAKQSQIWDLIRDLLIYQESMCHRLMLWNVNFFFSYVFSRITYSFILLCAICALV
jgi:hypothetical protein